MEIKKKKLVKIGDSHAFIVDAAYIRNGQISPDKLYNIEIKEADTNGT